MKHHRVFRLFTALAAVTLSFFSFALSVRAMGTATVGTTLTFQPPVPVSVGNHSSIVLQLISSKGEPVANQRVELFVNGKSERQAKTDSSGTVTFKVLRDEAGTYALSAIFKGSRLPSLGSSKAEADMVITPALVEVHVTPPLPKIKFALDDQVFASDDYGVARIEVTKAGKYHLELLPLDTKDPDIQMAFGRWSDDYFVPSRDIEIPLQKPLNVGLEVSYQVSQTFVDLDNKPVPLSRITSVTLKGSNGATYTFEDNLPHWLPAGRVIRLNNGLEETKILYSVISVVIDGSNVVSQAQQRFYVHQNDIWPVKLLLYSASFTARDALFRSPIGTGIHMEYPDGDVQTFNFEANHKHTIMGLARGIYRVTVIGAKGYAPPTPLALSRNQTMELMVFSYLDMTVLGSIGVIMALGLLFFGRPQLMMRTITAPIRAVYAIQKFRPAMLKDFYFKVIAAGARIVSKKDQVRLDNSNAITSLDNTIYPEAEIFNLSMLDQTPSKGTIFAENGQKADDQIVERIEDADVLPEQADRLSEPDQTGAMLAESNAAPAAVEDGQSEVAETTSEAPSDETGSAVEETVSRVCQVCGSSQLVRKETRRNRQQRYECQACGASNTFGAKRTRRHRHKNRVESLA